MTLASECFSKPFGFPRAQSLFILPHIILTIILWGGY